MEYLIRVFLLRKINLYILIFVFLFSYNSFVFSEEKVVLEKNMIARKRSFIKKIQSFNDVEFEGYVSKDSDLVLFDVDHTIFRPKEKYLQYLLSNDSKCTKKICELKNIHADKIDLNFFWGSIVKKSEVQVIEPIILEKIRFLKQKDVPFIAITAMPTGFNSGLQDSWQNWRFKQLKNIDFGGSFSEISFTLGASEFSRPIFFKGTIFTDYDKKGKILRLFLEKINKIANSDHSSLGEINETFLEDSAKNLKKIKNLSLEPKRIIMFDDSEKYLESVLESMNEIGIEFHGYHYKPYEISDWTDEDERNFMLNLDELIKEQNKIIF